MNPDGKVNVESLAEDLQFYKDQKLITGEVRLDQLVDHSFVDAALRALGPYRR
jgi:NitT/TauT family transport system substrate-binding protein